MEHICLEGYWNPLSGLPPRCREDRARSEYSSNARDTSKMSANKVTRKNTTAVEYKSIPEAHMSIYPLALSGEWPTYKQTNPARGINRKELITRLAKLGAEQSDCIPSWCPCHRQNITLAAGTKKTGVLVWLQHPGQYNFEQTK